MKYLVTITKTAEMEVDLSEAMGHLIEQGHNITEWSDKTIAKEYVNDLEADGTIDLEYDRFSTAIELDTP